MKGCVKGQEQIVSKEKKKRINNREVARNEILIQGKEDNSKYECILGIDADLHRSGIALMVSQELTFCSSMFMWELFDFLFKYKDEAHIVYLEAGHLVDCASWHQGGTGAARNVGMNNACSQIIEEFLKENGFNYRCVLPKGYTKFFSKVDFFKQQTGYKKTTNGDARSAAAIVFINGK